jgi:hypothetical protein
MTFKNIRKVHAVRSLGYGSPQLRDMATKELVGMIPLMDEVSRNHALRTRAASLPGIGQSMVDQFFPPIEKMGVPEAHASFATTENNALRTLGGKALVEPQQNHSIHFDTHAKDIQAHQQEQPDPAQLLIHLEQAGPHMAKHLQYISGDPTRKAEVKQKQAQLDGLAKMTDQLSQQVQEAAQAAQQGNGQQPQQDSETLVGLAKVHGELGLKAEKQQGDMLLKARKQMVDEKLKDAKTAAEIRRKASQTSSDAAIKAMGQSMEAKSLSHLESGQPVPQ